jgi:hypothetical protein
MDTKEFIQNKPEVQYIYTIQENGTDAIQNWKQFSLTMNHTCHHLFPPSLKSPSLFPTFPYFYLSPGLCIREFWFLLKFKAQN